MPRAKDNNNRKDKEYKLNSENNYLQGITAHLMSAMMRVSEWVMMRVSEWATMRVSEWVTMRVSQWVTTVSG